MSSIFGVIRKRWSTREMTVQRWLVEPHQEIKKGQPVCELNADGNKWTAKFAGDDVAWVWNRKVKEGKEVDPWGTLFEWSGSGAPGRDVIDEREAEPRQLKFERRQKYPPVFINYRRADGEAFAGRLHETLGREIGFDKVFMDQFSIEPGELSTWTIQQAVVHSSVMVSLIGEHWLEASDQYERRRLDLDGDYVRREITAALDRGIELIPVTLPRTRIPKRRKLPAEMGELVERQALELTTRHWADDAKLLIARIQKQLGKKEN